MNVEINQITLAELLDAKLKKQARESSEKAIKASDDNVDLVFAHFLDFMRASWEQIRLSADMNGESLPPMNSDGTIPGLTDKPDKDSL